MMKIISNIKIIILIITLHLSVIAKTHDKDLSRTIMNLKVTFSKQNPTIPWQQTEPSVISGQGIAISPNTLICLASLVQDNILIQIETYFQSKKIEAHVKMIDFDLNLCILEVKKEDLKQPFIPVKMQSDIKIGSKVDLIWFSKARRFIRTKATIEYPDPIYFKKNNTAFLYFQLSSDSSPEGYSEPVFLKNKLIGIIESFNQENKSSSMLPTNLIKLFIEKSKKPDYQGIAKWGFSAKKLIDKDTRNFSKLPDSETRGIFIQDIYDFGTGSSELKKGDIILSINGYDIDPSGNITHPQYGKLLFLYLLSTEKVGDYLTLIISRDGIQEKIQVQVKTFSPTAPLVPQILYNYKHNYYITGGFVFMELNYNYISAFGKWAATMNPLITEQALKYKFKKHKTKDRIVILSRVLKHPLNQGYQILKNKIVTKINNQPITKLQDVKDIFSKKPENDFYYIDFEGYTISVVLPYQKLPQINQDIKKIYAISETSYINN